MICISQNQYSFLILHSLLLKTHLKNPKIFLLTPEFPICKRHGDVEGLEVVNLAQFTDQHELIHIDQIDKGMFAISYISDLYLY